jgi:hypothetical protein
MGDDKTGFRPMKVQLIGEREPAGSRFIQYNCFRNPSLRQRVLEMVALRVKEVNR